MTNSIIENLSEQQKEIITKIVYEPRNEEVTASQLKRLVNLELIKNGLLPVLVDTELEQRSWGDSGMNGLIGLDEAIKALKAGKKVSRENWSDTDYYEKIGDYIYHQTTGKMYLLDDFDSYVVCDDNGWRVLDES